MATTVRIEAADGGVLRGMQDFLGRLLASGKVGGVVVPVHLFGKGMPMPTLVTDPEGLGRADPLAPAFPLNGAKLVSRLTRGRSGEKIAAVMRPCEIRAFVELVKLNQGSMDDVYIIGVDCHGAFSNTDYPRFVGEADPMAATATFLDARAKGAPGEGVDIARACAVCEHPVPLGADLVVAVFGADIRDHVPLMAASPRGEALLTGLGLAEGSENPQRAGFIEKLVAERMANLERMYAETLESTSSLEGLAQHLSACVNCYNCRVACPVCYCKECVFNTDVFEHQPWQYMGWAKRKGSLKLPTDTVFYHLTRMAHMSTACVGCGQCSNACPNGVHVMELFRTVAARTQASFDYVPGRSLDEAPPLSVFKEDEFQETVSHLAHGG
ncbi:formate dehydrogenase subunit beta [Desulfobaculum xiamenense]|uniref:Formate dehydrogenase subunit beta n=1 Tax=Desulfobaculum xiamenense TaxID=995050 RepID=A0A846QGD0_9BACT|nr:Coenzyme F420 hydrogenase/dehydrogenase, beta subunit C-terminal domain [Desulfobaculum xiamenense]NJB67291.1 formate dehydrogenase subunit beta [Desulfobaculum xiamenense]